MKQFAQVCSIILSNHLCMKRLFVQSAVCASLCKQLEQAPLHKQFVCTKQFMQVCANCLSKHLCMDSLLVQNAVCANSLSKHLCANSLFAQSALVQACAKCSCASLCKQFAQRCLLKPLVQTFTNSLFVQSTCTKQFAQVCANSLSKHNCTNSLFVQSFCAKCSCASLCKVLLCKLVQTVCTKVLAQATCANLHK